MESAPAPARSPWPLRLILLAAAAALIVFGYRWWTHGRYVESTDDAYVRADSTVITPRVGGEIVEVGVHDNQDVHKGDVLAKIDDRDYAARVASARAAVAAAQAALQANGEQIKLQQATVAQARATLAAANADQVRLDKDYKRAQQLVGEGVATQQRLDTATAAQLSGRAQIKRAEAALEAAQQQVSAVTSDSERYQAQIESQQAALALAELDLEATTLRAPIDGSVGDLAARLGERVAPGQRLMTLVPLAAVYVEANYKETQLHRMQIGQPVDVKVDAMPGVVIHGRVDSLSPASGAEFSLLPPQNATGNFTKIVQRVPVRIALQLDDATRGRLRPGMSVVADVDTQAAAAAH